MVGSNLKPILIKVKHLPSWGTDSPLNQDIKFHAIIEAMRVINVNGQDKKSFECARRRQSLAPITTRRGLLAGGFPLDNNVDARDVKGNNNQPRGDDPIGGISGQWLDVKEQILKGNNQIYPPSNKAGVSQERYSKMEKFTALIDAKQHHCLTCPPQQQKYVNSDVVENQTPCQSNRHDSWMGNILQATMMGGTKVGRPPTKKQIKLADRLSRGYSAKDTAKVEKSSSAKEEHPPQPQIHLQGRESPPPLDQLHAAVARAIKGGKETNGNKVGQ